MPVLTKFTAKVATGGGCTKDIRSRDHMKRRFLFYGINLKGGRLSIDKGVKPAFYILPVSTETPLST